MEQAFKRSLHRYDEQTGDESNCYQGASASAETDDNLEEFFPKSNPSEFAYGNRRDSPLSTAQRQSEAEVEPLCRKIEASVLSKKVCQSMHNSLLS